MRGVLTGPQGRRRSRGAVMGLVLLAVLGQGALAVPTASADPAGSAVAAGATEVTIGGTVRVGETVTALEGDWSPGTPTFAYEWRSDGLPVPGATGRDLVVARTSRARRCPWW